MTGTSSSIELTTVIIHYPRTALTFPLQPWNLPFPQTLPTVAFLLFYRTDRLHGTQRTATVTSKHIRFISFGSSFLAFFLVPFGKLSWLFVSCWAHTLKQLIVSCRILEKHAIPISRFRQRVESYFGLRTQVSYLLSDFGASEMTP